MNSGTYIKIAHAATRLGTKVIYTLPNGRRLNAMIDGRCTINGEPRWNLKLIALWETLEAVEPMLPRMHHGSYLDGIAFDDSGKPNSWRFFDAWRGDKKVEL